MDYKSTRWKQKRERILKRDGYVCQYYKRYGRTLPADTVHHIYPASKYPELAFKDGNLISLSRDAHNKMHDKNNNELTELGLRLQKRYTPPL